MDTRASQILLYLNHKYEQKNIYRIFIIKKKNPELQTYFCCITLTLLFSPYASSPMLYIIFIYLWPERHKKKHRKKKKLYIVFYPTV